MASMQPSDPGQAVKGSPTAMSSSKNYRTGASTSTKSTAPYATKSTEVVKSPEVTRKEVLLSVNEELAGLLVLYQQAGGQIVGITLPDGTTICDSRTVLVLPATVDDRGAFSLKEIE